MPKGQQVTKGESLVMYNTRLEKETKELTSALADVMRLPSQRELMHKMLESLERETPEVFERARQLVALKGGSL